MGEERLPRPQRGVRGGDDPGPRDVVRDRENPDLLTPPPTDAGTVPNLRFSFSDAHNRIERGGWTREVTQRELPIATELSGVDMRLEPGAYRELHWHKQSEWAYVLRGSCRISAVDQEGRTFLDDVRSGDLWFFPRGVPHHIQALDEGVEFLLVFDDGAFSEGDVGYVPFAYGHYIENLGSEPLVFLEMFRRPRFADISLAQWMANTPHQVVADTLNLPRELIEALPRDKRPVVR
ncbi:bicupin, oxalate decarboxylase family [Micromonospora echinaurantiaca]|uniref:Bicupin, oxalate decarboxylase family n=1 Tax=Micromonospora echinaurantiaca TaxID=47857 RepID=A0A1C5HUK6_9ACTN|nr:cupin domain-containing protein [Micromonospora echinaurantiaca]SCG49725.1 bicupin, oxalate decarboxylase family [Micromonospora echinaurantiaca]